MSRHGAHYMRRAQKGAGSDTRGAKHQQLLGRGVSKDCETRMTNLCTAWIDYKKAYDSIPHKRILDCLKPYRSSKPDRTQGADCAEMPLRKY